MKKIAIASGVVVVLVLVYAMLSKRKNLKKGIISPERKRKLAEQYKAQLDRIFSQAAQERRQLNAGEQVEVNRLQEKLIELGFIYEIPGGSHMPQHVFTPSAWRLQGYLN